MNGDLPDVTRADSLGVWGDAPGALLLPYRSSAHPGLTLIGAMLPNAVFEWVKTARPDRPYATRAAILVWSAGRAGRREIELAHGS
jgi:hypothetical protein